MLGTSDKRRKKARSALIKFRKLVKNKQNTIEKLEDYNDKIQEWNDMINDFRGFLKEFGVELDPEIERKLDEISDVVDMFKDPKDQIMEYLLEEIDKGIEDLNTSTGSDIPDALNSQRGSTDGAIPIKPAVISTPKIIAIIVVTIIIVGGGASAVLLPTSDNLVIIEEVVPTPKSTSLIFPANGQHINDKTPTFDWEKVSHPIGIVYTLKIFKENEANAVFYKSEIKNSQFTLDEPLEDGTYLWHILLRDASWQKGPESETNTFHVGDSDVDNDGIADRQDNCRTNFNPDQKDDDNDGLGNVCDKTPYKDTDGDKIFDNVDECIDEPENYNHYQDEDGCPDITVGIMQPKTGGEFKTSTKLK